MNVKPKGKDVTELIMDSYEFDRIMHGVLVADPPKAKRKQRIRRITKSKPGKT
jgi:hypothetical protein